MRRKLTYMLLIAIASAGIVSGQDSLAADIYGNATTANKNDTIITTSMLSSKFGGLNDSLLYIEWYKNVLSIIGIYHGQDTVNYFTGGNYDREAGQIHLGQKYPYYKNEPVRLVYRYGFDTTNAALNWYGGFNLAIGIGPCKFSGIQDSNKNLTPAVTFFDVGIAYGKKNYYLSLGLSYCYDGFGEYRDTDTIQIGTQRISPPKLSLFQTPLIVHYRCEPAKWISLIPAAGITYVSMKRNIRGYDTTTNMVTVNIDDYISRIRPQFGGKISLSIPIPFYKSEDNDKRIMVEGNYDRLIIDQGMNIFQLSLGISNEEKLSGMGQRTGWGLFYRESQSSKLRMKQLGVFFVGFSQ